MKHILKYKTKSDFINDKSKGEKLIAYIASVKKCYFNVPNTPQEVPYVKLTFADRTTRKDEYEDGVISATTPYSGDTSITSVEISSGITSITTEGLFYNCSNLQSATVNANITNLYNYMFGSCTSLTSCSLSSSITSLDYSCFYSCEALTSLNLENIITISKECFSYCTSLSSVTLDSSLSSIGDNAFQNNTALTEIKFSGTTAQFIAVIKGVDWITNAIATKVECTDGCVSIASNAVVACDGYVKLTFANGTTRIDTYANGVISGASPYSSNTSITSVEISKGISSITTRYLFSYCTNLTSATVNGNITDIPETMFSQSGLKSFVVPSSVTNIQYAAFFATPLSSVNFNNVVTLGSLVVLYCPIKELQFDKIVEFEHQALQGCTQLTSVTLASSLTTIGNYTFSGCSALDEIKFSGTTAQWIAVTKGTNWALNVKAEKVQCTDGCVSVSDNTVVPCSDAYVKLTLSDGTTRYDEYSDGVIPNEKYMSDTTISKVEIASGITSVGTSAFQYCDALTSVTMSNTVTSCGAYAFDNCVRLETINISSGMTEILQSFANGCASLTSLTIPSSIIMICENAFNSCMGLNDEYVKFSGTVSEWESITLQPTWNDGCMFTYIVCSDGISHRLS